MNTIKQIIFATVFIQLFINFQVQKNRFVSSEFKIEKHKQDKVTILIFLNPTEGIHVNSEPSPDVKFTSANAEIINVKFEKTQKNYIDISKPIKVDIRLKSKNIPTLNGEFTYFYCSEIEGWCSKATEKFEIKLNR